MVSNADAMRLTRDLLLGMYGMVLSGQINVHMWNVQPSPPWLLMELVCVTQGMQDPTLGVSVVKSTRVLVPPSPALPTLLYMVTIFVTVMLVMKVNVPGSQVRLHLGTALVHQPLVPHTALCLMVLNFACVIMGMLEPWDGMAMATLVSAIL